MIFLLLQSLQVRFSNRAESSMPIIHPQTLMIKSSPSYVIWRARFYDQCLHYGSTTPQQFQHRGRRAILVPESTRLSRKEAGQRTSKGVRFRTTSLSVISYVKALARLLRLVSLLNRSQ